MLRCESGVVRKEMGKAEAEVEYRKKRREGGDDFEPEANKNYDSSASVEMKGIESSFRRSLVFPPFAHLFSFVPSSFPFRNPPLDKNFDAKTDIQLRNKIIYPYRDLPYYSGFRARRSAFDVETGGCPKRDGGTTSQGKESLRHGREGRRGVCHDGRDWFQRGFRGGVR